MKIILAMLICIALFLLQEVKEQIDFNKQRDLERKTWLINYNKDFIKK